MHLQQRGKFLVCYTCFTRGNHNAQRVILGQITRALLGGALSNTGSGATEIWGQCLALLFPLHFTGNREKILGKPGKTTFQPKRCLEGFVHTVNLVGKMGEPQIRGFRSLSLTQTPPKPAPQYKTNHPNGRRNRRGSPPLWHRLSQGSARADASWERPRSPQKKEKHPYVCAYLLK